MVRQINSRPRLIYPTCTNSSSVNSKSPLAELLFWRLLACADDQGRLSGAPKNIKAWYAPFRPEIIVENIPALLKELEDDMIFLYGNPPVVQIINWWGWQRPQWAMPSLYPAPENWVDHIRYHEGQKVMTSNWPPNRSNGSLPTPLPTSLPTLVGTKVGETEREEKKEKREERNIVAPKGATPCYQEAKTFLDMVSSYENVSLLDFPKLLNRSRRVLIATKAPIEDLLDCYKRMRTDTFWSRLAPPELVMKLADQFPTYLKLKQEGRVAEFLKPTGREGRGDPDFHREIYREM